MSDPIVVRDETLPAGTLPLVQVIQQLREDLQQAVDAARQDPGQSGDKLRFSVEEMELELQVVASQSSTEKDGGGLGVKLYVFDAKASTEVSEQYGQSVVQKVKLKLKPELTSSDGARKPVEVAAEGDLPGLDD